MTIVLSKKTRKPARGRPKMSAVQAARWWPVVQHFNWQYIGFRLRKATGRGLRGETPYDRAVQATAAKFHMSKSTVRRAVDLFGYTKPNF